MDPEQQREWRELQRRAEAELRRGSPPAQRGVRVARVAQVLVMPAFANWVASDVYRITDAGAEQFVATRSMWDQVADAACFATPLERLRHPQAMAPTLVHARHALPQQDASQLAHDVAALAVQLAPQAHHLGLDGTTFVLTLGDPFAELSIRWWQSPPSNWTAVARLADRVVELVDAAVG